MQAKTSAINNVTRALVVAVLYVILGYVAGALANPASDAWTVWFASGAVFGLLVASARQRWPAILTGAFVGALAFAMFTGNRFSWALGYGCIEVVTALTGAWIAALVAGPARALERPRDLAALVLGALALAFIGAVAAALWSVAAASAAGWITFRVWFVGTFVGAMVIASLVVSWAGFRVKRSGGLPASAFIGGLVACALFLVTLMIPMGGLDGGALHGFVDESLTYLPFVCFAVLALLWGVRGATLVALAATLIAITLTNQGRGPFTDTQGLLGDPVLEVQCYALAISLTGLLVATLAAGQRRAMQRARDWQTRFEAAISAHRLLAYDWDPHSGRFSVSGDSAQLLGVAPARLATLADWMARVDGVDRERVETGFGERGAAGGARDVLAYALVATDGRAVAVSDEAVPIRDHDGELMRITGIVRIADAT